MQPGKHGSIVTSSGSYRRQHGQHVLRNNFTGNSIHWFDSPVSSLLTICGCISEKCFLYFFSSQSLLWKVSTSPLSRNWLRWGSFTPLKLKNQYFNECLVSIGLPDVLPPRSQHLSGKWDSRRYEMSYIDVGAVTNNVLYNISIGSWDSRIFQLLFMLSL